MYFIYEETMLCVKNIPLFADTISLEILVTVLFNKH